MISSSNGMPFRVRHQDRSTSINANAGCTATRRSGYFYCKVINKRKICFSGMHLILRLL